MKKSVYYKLLFQISAIWNWIVAMLLLILSIFALNFTATLFGMAIPPSLIWFHTIAGLIFVFGVGYFIISQDLDKNWGLVLVGALEKFLFFFILLLYLLWGDINSFVFLLTGVDLVLGCLYLEFLLNYNKREK